MRTLKSILAAVALLALPLFGLAAEAAAPAVQDTLHAVTNAVGEAGAAHPEGGEHKVAHTLPLAAPVLKSIQITDGFAFKITNSMLVMALVAVGLIIFAQLATKNVQLVPKGLQNFAEWVVESLSDFLAGILGPKLTKQTFWFFATVFLFILSANWFGLLPGVGTFGWGTPDASGHIHHISHPVLRGANADMNMTLALALGFFMMWIIWSIQHNGVGGVFSHIFVYHGEAQGGMRMMLFVMFFLVGFLEVISIMIRPVTLNFRLFGNVYAGETLLETMLHKGGFLAALPFYFLELMVGAIQALVFTLLTAVFTALMCRHDDAHEAAGEKEAAHH